MLTLITGGAACGKSEYAEQLAISHGGKRIYIATMQPYGTDADLRIARHRKLRQGKGFHTIEWYTDLARLDLGQGGTVLLECLGNLAANELFTDGAGWEDARDSVLYGISSLAAQADNLIMVGNDISSDGCVYTKETMAYIELVANVTGVAAALSQRVAEVVCGIPVWHKGGEL